ncbi:hypothetical protein ABZ897_08260 [Nonomuraea sp. NPDC046802]|uniref:protein kinase domain-containing protein n=1 Tax=Nonomuraea sp. NPDC046802 TaxID=3154919 RepID=UPI0033DEB58C
MLNQPRLVGGRYRLLAPIGQGGMGVVWQAHDTAIGREVAIKQVHIPPTLSPDDHARTLHEARAAAHVRHPSVVAIHDVVEDGAKAESEAGLRDRAATAVKYLDAKA